MSGSTAVSAAHRPNNMGPAPFKKGVVGRRTTGYSQADFRHTGIATDQHGREWSCNIENSSGMPTGLICNDFRAPWLPEQQYLVINPLNPSDIWIDYRQMYLDRRSALVGYHDLAVQLSTEKSWPLPTKRGVYSTDVRRMLGRPPQPLEPVRAAAQNNPWILGFSEEIDPRLAEFVVIPDALDMEMDDGIDFSEDGYLDAIHGDEAIERAPAVAEKPYRPAVMDETDFEELDEIAEEAVPEEEGASIDDDLPLEEEEPVETLLDELEDGADAQALGGRTVGASPAAAERAERQAPRRSAQKVAMPKKAQSRGNTKHTLPSLRKKAGVVPTRGTLAEGAKARVSDGGRAHQFQRPLPKKP